MQELGDTYISKICKINFQIVKWNNSTDDMQMNEVYKSENGSLTVEIEELTDLVTIKFIGQSLDLQPGLFLNPIFEKHIINNDKEIVMDFVQLRSLSSPTLSPVIQTLNRANGGSRKAQVIYNSDYDWQVTTFTAFEVYAKPEQIVISGTHGE